MIKKKPIKKASKVKKNTSEGTQEERGGKEALDEEMDRYRAEHESYHREEFVEYDPETAGM